jgi:hypothetical protein
MLRITPTLVLLCLIVESHAADNPHFSRGPHLLHTTFDEKDPHWNFNHDVKVRSKGEQLTLIVLDDKKDQDADNADSKQGQGGLGNLSESGIAKSSERPLGPEPLLSAQRKLHGSGDTEGELRFGVTTIYDGKLVSLHFIGRTSLGGATGKVYLLSSQELVREGTWFLKNSFSRSGSVPGFNGTGPFGR